MALKKIRLELARDHDFPEGSSEHGYEFIAPVNAEGLFDPDEWKAHRGECRVTRFWGDDDVDRGHLVRKPGGHWAFHYDIYGVRTMTRAATGLGAIASRRVNMFRSANRMTGCAPFAWSRWQT
jgi:hypothetical protein